jgi:thiol:disulfide interchange protein
MIRRTIVGIALLAIVATAVFAQGGPELELSTILGLDAIPSGSESRAALSVTLPEGWHVNANEPLEAYLIKTELTFEDSDVFEVLGVKYAEPEIKKFGFSDEPMAVYEGEFLIGYRFRVREGVAVGNHELVGTLRYQACDDTSCYAPKNVPVTAQFKVEEASYTPTEANALRLESVSFAMAKDEPAVSTPIVFGGVEKDDYLQGEVVREFDGVKPGETLRLAVQMDIVEPFHVNGNKPLDDIAKPTVWTLEVPEGFSVVEIAHPEAEVKTFGFQDEPLAVYDGLVTIGGMVKAVDATPGEYVLQGTLKYQACDDKVCYRPITESFEIPLRVLSEDETSVRLAKAEIFEVIEFTGEYTAPEIGSDPTPMETVDAGDWESLLPEFEVLAQAAGIMEVRVFTAFIDGAESGEGFSQSGYLEGKSIWFVIGAAIIGGLLLNMTPCVLPVIPINLAIIGAGVQGMKEGSSRGRGFALGGVYGLGIALVFGALGLVVVLGLGSFGSINANWWFSAGIAVLFIALALAMFDVIAIDFSKFQTKLGIQQSKGSFAFAFIMGSVSALLAGACVAPALIAVLLYSQDIYAKGSTIGLVLPFMLGLGMALPWPFAGAGLSFMPKPGMWMVRLKQAMGVFILGFALYYGWIGYGQFSAIYLLDKDEVLQSAQEADEDGWIASLGDGLALAKAEDRPVLIDFWATWCKNCLTMNKTTLKDETIKDRLENYVKIKYQAEMPDDSPHKEVLAHFDKYVGLPHYAILTP